MIKKLINKQIDARERELYSLREIQKLYESIPETGELDPKMYADIVNTLLKVGMHVVSRNAIYRWEELILQLEEDGVITSEDANSYISVISQSATGILDY